MSNGVLETARIQEFFTSGDDFGDVFSVLLLAELAIEQVRLTLDREGESLTAAEQQDVVREIESLRNRSDASAVDAARRLEATGHQREDGYFTTAAWLRHFVGLSSAESRVRMQVVRLFDALPAWEQAARDGLLDPERARAAARTFALADVREAFVEQSAGLLEDALVVSFARFEQLLANLRRLAAPERAKREAERRHDRRRLSMRPLADGSWRLSGVFGDVQGAEINDVLAHLNDAEFRSDWQHAKDAAEASGDPGAAPSFDELRRCEPQRRADAFHHALMSRAATASDDGPALPTLNVLIDWETFTTEVDGRPHDPSRYRDMVCRTQDGQPLPIAEASSTALYAHLRRVVFDSAGTVTDLGRRRRLFTGAAREAVMLPHSTCIWPGCEAPVRRSEADHHAEWARKRGPTSPCNGGPMCDRHNLLKERHRHQVRRLPDGTYEFTDATGRRLD